MSDETILSPVLANENKNHRSLTEQTPQDRTLADSDETRPQFAALAVPEIADLPEIVATMKDLFKYEEALTMLAQRAQANLLNSEPGFSKVQRELQKRVSQFADTKLQEAKSSGVSEDDRNTAMADYARMMDQLAIRLPLEDYAVSKSIDLQQEALAELVPYFDQHPNAKDVAHWVFMEYHHGAAVDKNVYADNFKRTVAAVKDQMQKGEPVQPPDDNPEYARQYIASELQAKTYLERFVALASGREGFSLDRPDDYQRLLDVQLGVNEDTSTYIMDVANWYRRVAKNQRIIGESAQCEANARKAEALYRKLNDEKSLADLGIETGLL